jgi:hypothetical protein
MIPPATNEVSWVTMLGEMTNMQRLVYPPAAGERSILFSSSSSTSKVSLAYLAPEPLGDLDHGFFYAVKDTTNGVEATLAEMHGPGAITWIWSAKPCGQLMLFVDNEQVPVLTDSFANFLAGSTLAIQYPFTAYTAYGCNLHFPIIHTNYCRVALKARDRKELSTLFYQVAWNSLASRTNLDVIPFSLDDVRKRGGFQRALADGIKHSQETMSGIGSEATKEKQLAAGERCDFLTSLTNGVITALEIKTPNKGDFSSLRIEACWDGMQNPSVSCPLSALLGVSELAEDTTSLPATLHGSTAMIRWMMPYGPNSRITLRNGSTHAINVAVKTWTNDALFDARMLRFHCQFVRKENLQLNARNIVTLMTARGPGRIVGACIRVDSHSKQWWGEGDPIFWLDSEVEPAWQGTGTEDYFGFAWCSDTLFSHPFRGQTRADGSRTLRRQAAMHRYHLLDVVPFSRFGRFDMEAWGLGEGWMDYEAAAMWYADLNWERFISASPQSTSQ